MYGAALTPYVGGFGVWNVLYGLVGCCVGYGRGRLYLWWFLVVYYVDCGVGCEYRQIQEVFIIVTAGVVVFQVYRQLIFDTLRDNILYFMGFFTIAALHILQHIISGNKFSISHFDLTFGPIQKALICPIFLILSYSILTPKINALKQTQYPSQTLKNPNLFIHYIKNLQQQLKTEQKSYKADPSTNKNKNKNKKKIYCQIYLHKQKCVKLDCFCRCFTQERIKGMGGGELEGLGKEILNYQYMDMFENNCFEADDKHTLTTSYIQFLITHKQLPRAILLLSQTNPQTHPTTHLHHILTQVLTSQQYFNTPNTQKISHLRDYDLHIAHTVKQIREILKMKCEVWTQLCLEAPRVRVLERSGRALVDRIQGLHQWFMGVVRGCEEVLGSYRCTMVYATYLIMTTNYIQFANSLTKKIQKTLEQNKSQLELNGQVNYGLFLKVVQNYNRFKQNLFQLSIENVSTGLMELLGGNKRVVLGRGMDVLIPGEFVRLHDKGFDAYVRGWDFRGVSSQFVGKARQLPFRMNATVNSLNNYFPFYQQSDNTCQIKFLNITSYLHFDPLTNSINFRCILKRLSNDSINFIVDIDGFMVYREQEWRRREEERGSERGSIQGSVGGSERESDWKGVCEGDREGQSGNVRDYTQIPQVQKILTQLREEWERDKSITGLSVRINQKQNPLSLIFQPLYPVKLSQQGYKPLIRITAKSDTLKYHTLKTHPSPLKSRPQAQSPHKQTQTDSQTSNTSRKDSIENIICMLTESSSLKLELFLSLTLMLMLVVAIASFFTAMNLFAVWDTGVMERSPSFTVVSLINMKSMINSVISWEYDWGRVGKAPGYMDGLYAQLYNGTSIKEVYDRKLAELLKKQKNIFNNYILGQKTLLTPQLQTLLSKPLQIHNPVHRSHPQNMSIQSVLLNYLVDMHNLPNQHSYTTTLLSFSFIEQVYAQIVNIRIRLQSRLERELQIVRNWNIGVICVVSVVLAGFVVPMWRFLVGNKGKHAGVYRLLASIEGKFILDQIYKLERIESQVFVNLTIQSKQVINNLQEKFTSFHQVQIQEKLQHQPTQKRRRSSNLNSIWLGIQKIAKAQLELAQINTNSIKVRKRAGQVDLEGSDCDRKNFKLADWGAVFFLLIFIAVMHMIFWQKMSYINKVDNQFKMSVEQLKNLEDNTIALLNSKLMADDYTNEKKIYFMGEDIRVWIRNWIINYNSSSHFPIQNQINIKRCSANIMACKNLFSQKIFQGLIKKSISDSYQWSKAALDPVTFSDPSRFNNDTVTLQKTRYMLFFAQQLTDHITEQRLKWSIQSFKQLQKSQIQQQRFKTIFNIMFWIFVAIFCLFSVLYTIYVKKIYVKQVTLLSILNKQMLYNNKRVQSFLQRLSKNY